MWLIAKDYEFSKTLPDSAFIEELLNFRRLVVNLIALILGLKLDSRFSVMTYFGLVIGIGALTAVTVNKQF